MLSNRRHSGYRFALLAAMLFSSEGIFIRFISLEIPSIIYFQGIFATIIISIIFLSSKNSRLFRPKGGFNAILVVSIINILTRLFLFQSMKLIPIAISVFILYTFPLQIIILSYFFLRENIDRKILVSFVFAFSGIILILLFQETQFTFMNYLGYVLALASSFSNAIFIVFIKKYLKGESSYTVSFYIWLLSAIIMQIWIFFDGSYSIKVVSSDFSYLVIFAVVAVLGMLFMVQSLKLIKAQEYSILAYFEPLSAYILGALILQQYLKVTSILGGVLICISGLIIFWRSDEQS